MRDALMLFMMSSKSDQFYSYEYRVYQFMTDCAITGLERIMFLKFKYLH